MNFRLTLFKVTISLLVGLIITLLFNLLLGFFWGIIEGSFFYTLLGEIYGISSDMINVILRWLFFSLFIYILWSLFQKRVFEFKKLGYTLKGLFIGSLVTLILSAIIIFFALSCNDEIGCMGAGYMVYYGVPFILISGVVLGALIGFIIGKLKSRNQAQQVTISK